MAEGLLPINWPFGGLSETLGFSDQELGTAREYQNVRGLDPSTGRLRGAQRPGMSKYLTSTLNGNSAKIQDLLAYFDDNRLVSYSAFAIGSETTTWDTATPSQSDCLGVQVDRQGNVYALDGNAAVVKYSADGAKIWQLAIPVDDPNHIIRAFHVDQFDHIYVGVSTGGEQEKAKLFCYEQLPDDKTSQLWVISPKYYIENCVTFQGKLYTIQNQTDRKRAFVRVYDFIDETAPEQVQEWRVPYPVNSIAVKADGAVIVACEPDGDTSGLFWRARDPKYPDSSPDSVDWTPILLSNSDRRIWAWYKADEIDQTDCVTDIAEGVEVSRWRDSSKNLRHFFAPYDDAHNDTGANLTFDSYLQHKGLRFTQPGNINDPDDPPFQAYKTLPNASDSKTFADQQNTMLPGYGTSATPESAFAVYIVCRPSETAQDNASGTTLRPRILFGQDRDNAQSGADDHILFVNANANNATVLPPTTSPGGVFWYTGEATASGGDGFLGQIKPGTFTSRNDASTNIPDGSTTNKGQITIICMICDGAVSGMTAGSMFAINGSPIDSFSSKKQFTLRPTYLGIWRPTEGSQTPTSVEGFKGDILEILVLDRKDRNLASENILSFDNLQFNSPAASQTINENTLILGYLAHKYGSQHNLPYGTAASNNYPHPFGITGSTPDYLSGPPNQAGAAVSDAQAKANKRFGCVVKYSAEGKIVWTANEMATGDGSRPGGFGYAVAVNSEGNIYSLGPNPTGAAGGVQQVRMIVDQGTTFSISSGDGAWSAAFDGNREQTYHFPRVDVDQFDNLYIPYHQSDATAASVRVYKKDGTVLHSQVFGSPQNGTAVAVDRKIPDYRNDLSTKTVEHVIVAGQAAEIGLETIVKLRLVQATQTGDPPRELVTIGVAGGNINLFTPAGTTTPTGGSGALDNGAYVQSTALFKKAYWTDGKHLKVYDSITNEVVDYKSLGPGSMPDRCSLIESWRGRIVLARSADEPHNWFMSKKDEPNNFDYFPPVPGETDAVAGNNSPAGLCPDIINSLVPYSEDILVFGGDHTIWAMVGDPAAGGRLELVSDTTGMSFGRPWCKDPNGVLYFFGSMGGIFRWVPGSRPERVSVSKIERQLQNVDLSTHYIRLIYNRQDEGIHILQMPFGNGGTQVSHWFYELKTNAFAKDIFGTAAFTNVQPTAAMVIDGDAFDDRAVLFGCEDGHIRKWDRSSKRDDTKTDDVSPLAIDAFFTIFPVPGLEEDSTAMETQFSGLTVVLSDQLDGARYELFASEEPENIGLVRRKGTLVPGRNPPKWDRITGPYCGIRIRNAAADQSFAFERAYVRYSVAGLARPGKPR